MADDYTPSTGQVRDVYAAIRASRTARYDLAECQAEFDRWLAVTVRQAKADAIREAADKFQWGGWADTIKGRVELTLGNAQRVVAWLRQRADQIESGGDQT